MATITLKYNPRNKLALKTIDYVLSLGIFETESKPRPGAEITRKALRDVAEGRVYKAKDADDLIRQCLES